MEIIHHATVKQVERLEEVFASLTEQGWKIPMWVEVMKSTVREKVKAGLAQDGRAAAL